MGSESLVRADGMLQPEDVAECMMRGLAEESFLFFRTQKCSNTCDARRRTTMLDPRDAALSPEVRLKFVTPSSCRSVSARRPGSLGKLRSRARCC